MPYILIATEDSRIAETLQGEIEGEGYSSLWCVTGQEAYETVVSQEVQLVFLDSALGVFDAFETCEMLREDPDVPDTLPVIYVTGFEPDTRRLDAAGFNGVLHHVHTRQDLRELLGAQIAGG